MKKITWFAIITAYALFPLHGSVPEIQIEGKPYENFEFAQFRLWVPPRWHSDHLICLTWGANQSSLPIADDAGWQEFAESLNCALLTCYFRPREFDVRWDLASRGTGRALLEALSRFAKITTIPKLEWANMYLVGDSQGGQFCYHFAAWNPQRCLGFVSLKGGNHDTTVAPSAASVPGLFVIGEFDSPCRVENIQKTFSNKKSGVPWYLAVEPNSKHSPDRCGSLTADFIQSVARNQSSGATDPYALQSFNEDLGAFQKTGILDKYPMLTFYSKKSKPIAIAGPPILNLSPIASGQRSSVFTFQVAPTTANLWDDANIQPGPHLISVAKTKSPPDKISFSCQYDSTDMPLGPMSDDIPVRFSLLDKPVLGGLNIPILASIVGNIDVSPPSVYLGAIKLGSTIEAELKLTSRKGTMINLLSYQAPNGIKLEVKSKALESLLVHITFNITNPDEASGMILISVETKEPCLLRIPYIGVTEEASK